MLQHPPANIDGVSGSEEMTRMWQKHLCDLYDCAGVPALDRVKLIIRKMLQFLQKKCMTQIEH